MAKIKFLVVSVLIALMAAFVVTGCSTFSGESSSSERLAVAKTVAKSVLKLVVSSYQAGGSELAESQIDSMVTDGKLTEAQAVALKSMLGGSVSALENLANPDSGETTTTDDSTPTAERGFSPLLQFKKKT